MAANDPEVNAVMLLIDSPGGTVSGTSDLGADIRSVDAIKPCYAYCQDMTGSAAYWAASQCRKIFANANATVGCIGTMSVLEDTSDQLKQDGITMHLVTSDVPAGQTTAKGMGTSGMPVTAEVLAEVKRTINDQNDLFVADVAKGRKLSPDRVRAMADGRVHVGAKAKTIGLVDEIASLDAAMQAAYQESFSMTSDQFKAFAAANPEDPAVKSLIAQGQQAASANVKTDAAAESRQQLAAMMAAFPGREKFAAEQFAKGHDISAAKAALSDVLITELADANAKLAKAAAPAGGEFSGVRFAPPGSPALDVLDKGAAPDSAKAITDFEDAWKAHVAKGMPANKAIAKVVQERPDLHAAYTAAQTGRRAK